MQVSVGRVATASIQGGSKKKSPPENFEKKVDFSTVLATYRRSAHVSQKMSK